MNNAQCTPAIVYIMIIFFAVCVYIAYNYIKNTKNISLGSSISSCLCICFVFFMITGLCKNNIYIAWTITIFLSIILCCSMSIQIKDLFK